MLDEAATVEESEAEDEDGYDDYVDDDGSTNVDNDDGGDDASESDKKAAKRARLLADYAKARIPKPPLAEANFVMNKLSDDDKAFMRRALLIGIEMKDGSVTFPLGSVNVKVGARCRFFVRDGEFAKKEVS